MGNYLCNIPVQEKVCLEIKVYPLAGEMYPKKRTVVERETDSSRATLRSTSEDLDSQSVPECYCFYNESKHQMDGIGGMEIYSPVSK